MRIAQVAPLAESCPPALYGGTERVVSYLTEELVAQGHQVTLFASGDSITEAELVACSDKALRLSDSVVDALPHHMILLERVMRRADEFDVIHFHIDLMHAPVVRAMAVRTLTTLHGRLDLPDLQPFYRAFPDLPLVSISNFQRRPLPPVNWAGTVYHGLPANVLRPLDKPEGYLAFLGRISPEKRPDRAIEIAVKAGMKLKIAAKIDRVDRGYWRDKIEPMVRAAGGFVEYIGEITEHEKRDFLGNAHALLFPIDWDEPFGLVMIEAMACGTPVIAYGRGSVPEVVDHGQSGFVVSGLEEAVSAVARVAELDRHSVRRTFERRFTVERMTHDYVDLYRAQIQSAEAGHVGISLANVPDRTTDAAFAN